MQIRPFRFELQARVVHITHTRDHAGWVGLITGREYYEDFDGHGHWYYVRWIEPDGKVSADKQRMPECELVLIPTQ